MNDEITQEIEIAKDQAPGDIIFYLDHTKEMLKLCPNGDIFVRGKLVENDKEVVDGLRDFFIETGNIKRCICIGPPSKDCPVHK